MLLAVRNVLLDSTSVTFGGTASGGALNDVNVLRQPYNGTPFIHNRYSFGTGGCWIEFVFNAAQVRALGVLMDFESPGGQITYEVRSPGGSLNYSGVLPRVDNGLGYPVLHGVDFEPNLPGYGGTFQGRIRFDFDMNFPNDPRAVIRCFAAPGIGLSEYRDRLILRDTSTGDRSLLGAWNSVEGTRRREVAVTAEDLTLLQAFGNLGSTAIDSFGEAFTIIGSAPEVLLLHPSPRFSMLGRFATKPQIDRAKGGLNTASFTVREL